MKKEEQNIKQQKNVVNSIINSILDDDENLAKEKIASEEIGAMDEDYFDNLIKHVFNADGEELICYLNLREKKINELLKNANNEISNLNKKNSDLLKQIEFLKSIRGSQYEVKIPAEIGQNNKQVKVDKKVSDVLDPDLIDYVDIKKKTVDKNNEIKSNDSDTSISKKKPSFIIASNWREEAYEVSKLFTNDSEAIYNGLYFTDNSEESKIFKAVLCNQEIDVQMFSQIIVSRNSFLEQTGFSYLHLAILLGNLPIMKSLISCNKALLFASDARGNLCLHLFYMGIYFKEYSIGCEFDIMAIFQLFITFLVTKLNFSEFLSLFSPSVANVSKLSLFHRSIQPEFLQIIQNTISNIILNIRRASVYDLHSKYCCDQSNSRKDYTAYNANCLRSKILVDEITLLDNTNNILFSNTKYFEDISNCKNYRSNTANFVHEICVTENDENFYTSFDILSPFTTFENCLNTFGKLKEFDLLKIKQNNKLIAALNIDINKPVYSVSGNICNCENSIKKKPIQEVIELIILHDRIYYYIRNINDNDYTDYTEKFHGNKIINYKEIQSINILSGFERFAIININGLGDLLIDIPYKYVFIWAIYSNMKNLPNANLSKAFFQSNFLIFNRSISHIIYNSQCNPTGIIISVKQPSTNIYGEVIVIPIIHPNLFHNYAIKRIMAAAIIEVAETEVLDVNNYDENLGDCALVILNEHEELNISYNPSNIDSPNYYFHKKNCKYAKAQRKGNVARESVNNIFNSLSYIFLKSATKRSVQDNRYYIFCQMRKDPISGKKNMLFKYHSEPFRDYWYDLLSV